METQEEKKIVYLCRRCGRKLNSAESQRLGMGNVCYRRWLAEHKHKKLFSIAPLQIDKNNV